MRCSLRTTFALAVLFAPFSSSHVAEAQAVRSCARVLELAGLPARELERVTLSPESEAVCEEAVVELEAAAVARFDRNVVSIRDAHCARVQVIDVACERCAPDATLVHDVVGIARSYAAIEPCVWLDRAVRASFPGAPRSDRVSIVLGVLSSRAEGASTRAAALQLPALARWLARSAEGWRLLETETRPELVPRPPVTLLAPAMRASSVILGKATAVLLIADRTARSQWPIPLAARQRVLERLRARLREGLRMPVLGATQSAALVAEAEGSVAPADDGCGIVHRFRCALARTHPTLAVVEVSVLHDPAFGCSLYAHVRGHIEEPSEAGVAALLTPLSFESMVGTAQGDPAEVATWLSAAAALDVNDRHRVLFSFSP